MSKPSQKIVILTIPRPPNSVQTGKHAYSSQRALRELSKTTGKPQLLFSEEGRKWEKHDHLTLTFGDEDAEQCTQKKSTPKRRRSVGPDGTCGSSSWLARVSSPLGWLTTLLRKDLQSRDAFLSVSLLVVQDSSPLLFCRIQG